MSARYGGRSKGTRARRARQVALRDVVAPRALADVPRAARDHVRAAVAGALRPRLQLRRDLRRHPGPGHPAGRRALRGRHRSQAATRAVRVRRDVLVLRDDGTVVGARRRHARRGAHRVVARDRGPPPLRRARRLDRRDPVRVGDGRVRATGRAGRELRGLHVAVDGGGDPPRATRARRGRGRGSRGRHVGEADRSGDADPRAVSPRPRARAPRRRGGGRGLRGAARSGSARRRPGTAHLLGGARQRLVPQRQQRVGDRRRDVRADDARLGRVQRADPLEAAARVARPSRARARRAARHRLVAVARVGSAVGCDRAAVLWSLLHAAGAAPRVVDRGRAGARASRGRRRAPSPPAW